MNYLPNLCRIKFTTMELASEKSQVKNEWRSLYAKDTKSVNDESKHNGYDNINREENAAAELHNAHRNGNQGRLNTTRP